MTDIMGRVHSRETFGAVDGPGVRFVLFTQGCAMRCKFCHNPDTWALEAGELVSANAIIKEISTYLNFIKNGGVTISGGEPLLQPDFVKAIIDGCHKMGLHTAIDTAGGAQLASAIACIDAADLLLLDIKCIDNTICRELTGVSNANELSIIEHCDTTHKSVWLRHVLVPGYTLNDELLERLADYAVQHQCIKKIELLPFHKLGEFKWHELSLSYALSDIQPPSSDEIKHARDIFIQKGLEVI